MKALVRALLALLLALPFLMTHPASAENRVQWFYGMNPPSPWMNTATRFHRLGFGQLMFDDFGRTTSGWYSNLAITPAGALTIQVGPSTINTQGSLYQFLVDDASTFGGGPYGAGTALAADATQIYVQGLTNANLGAITMSVGSTTGQTINNLIECQIQTSDKTSQSVNFVSSAGIVTPGTANRDRDDLIVCQGKPSASASSPLIPSVDTGWVGVGYVAVPFGTATITGGMVFPLTANQFNGFALAGAPGSTAVDTSAMAQVKLGPLGIGAPGSYNANGLAIGTGFASGATSTFVSSPTLSAGGVTADYLGIYETGGINGLAWALNHSGDVGIAGAIKSGAGLTSANLTSGNCVQAGAGGALSSASGPCGLGSGTITSVGAGSNILVTGSGSAPVVGVVSGPTFTGSVGALAFNTGSSSLGANSFVENGNIESLNGVFAAGPGASLQLCPNNSCSVGTVIDATGNLTVHNFVNALSMIASNGIFEASTGQFLSLCPNGTCANDSYIDLSGNFHTNVIAATQFNGSGAGLTTGSIPNNSLQTTDIVSVQPGNGGISTSQTAHTAFVSNAGVLSLNAGPGISGAIGGQTPTISNTGVLSTSGSGSILSSGGQNPVISQQMLFEGGVFRPTGLVCAGQGITNGAGQLAVGCGTTAVSATGTLFDSGFANPIVIRLQSIVGGTVTFGASNTSCNCAQGGAGIYYAIYGYN